MGPKRQGPFRWLRKTSVMQIKLFTMPAYGGEAAEEEINRFLRSHRVLQLERHYVADNGGYWAMLIEYADGDPVAEAPPASRRDRKDPTEGMTDEEKARFNVYRDIRKVVSQRRAIPPYLVFTNEELAILARLPVVNEETVKGLKGIAPQRLKDYIANFYNLTTANGEESGPSDDSDSQSGESA